METRNREALQAIAWLATLLRDRRITLNAAIRTSVLLMVDANLGGVPAAARALAAMDAARLGLEDPLLRERVERLLHRLASEDELDPDP